MIGLASIRFIVTAAPDKSPAKIKLSDKLLFKSVSGKTNDILIPLSLTWVVHAIGDKSVGVCVTVSTVVVTENELFPG